MRQIILALCVIATLGDPSVLVAQDALDQAMRAAASRPRPGDRVALKVFDGEASISDVATVDETGRIMLPKIGLIQADAMPIPAIRARSTWCAAASARACPTGSRIAHRPRTCVPAIR